MQTERGDARLNPVDTEVELPKEIEKKQADIIIFDAPFHSDPELAGQALDDSGMKQEIPRGALSVATLLERHGLDAKVVPTDSFIHAQGREKNGEEVDFKDRIKNAIDKVLEEHNPKVVGISYMFSPTTDSVLFMEKYIKDKYPDTKVIIGGNNATFDEKNKEKLLNPETVGTDAVVNFEGEWTALNLMDAFEKANSEGKEVDIKAIAGVSYWNGERVVNNPRRERGNPAEVGPLNYKNVILPEGVKIGDFNHYVLFARGCAGRCAFCTSKEFWQNMITSIGLKSFREELETVAGAVHEREGREKNIGILDDDLLMELWFDADGNIVDDELQAIEKKTVFEIINPVLKGIHEKYPEINFIAQARVGHLRGEVDQEVEKRYNPRANTRIKNPEILTDMKESGINFVLLGIESGNQQILDHSIKQTKKEWVEPACRALQEAKIGVGAFWIIGLPGSTKEGEEESLAFLADLVEKGVVDEIEAHVLVPLPGTLVRKTMKGYKVGDDFDESSSKALFDEEPPYERVDKEGKTTLSREDIKELFNRTRVLSQKLKEKKASEGEISVVKV